MTVTKALKIASSFKKNSKSVIMTNFQFSKSLQSLINSWQWKRTSQ